MTKYYALADLQDDGRLMFTARNVTSKEEVRMDIINFAESDLLEAQEVDNIYEQSHYDGKRVVDLSLDFLLDCLEIELLESDTKFPETYIELYGYGKNYV